MQSAAVLCLNLNIERSSSVNPEEETPGRSSLWERLLSHLVPSHAEETIVRDITWDYSSIYDLEVNAMSAGWPVIAIAAFHNFTDADDEAKQLVPIKNIIAVESRCLHGKLWDICNNKSAPLLGLVEITVSGGETGVYSCLSGRRPIVANPIHVTGLLGIACSGRGEKARKNIRT